MTPYILIFWLGWAASFESIEFTNQLSCEYALERVQSMNEDVSGVCVPKGGDLNGQD